MKKLIVCVLVVALASCTNPHPDYDLLEQQLIPVPELWKEAYGDTKDLQRVYNLAALVDKVNKHEQELQALQKEKLKEK